MAVLASILSQQYTPQVASIPFTVGAAVTRVQITLTHANTLIAWPSGALLRIDWDWGQGYRAVLYWRRRVQ